MSNLRRCLKTYARLHKLGSACTSVHLLVQHDIPQFKHIEIVDLCQYFNILCCRCELSVSGSRAGVQPGQSEGRGGQASAPAGPCHNHCPRSGGRWQAVPGGHCCTFKHSLQRKLQPPCSALLSLATEHCQIPAAIIHSSSGASAQLGNDARLHIHTGSKTCCASQRLHGMGCSACWHAWTLSSQTFRGPALIVLSHAAQCKMYKLVYLACRLWWILMRLPRRFSAMVSCAIVSPSFR